VRAAAAAAAVVAAVWLPAQMPLHADARHSGSLQALEQAWSPQRVEELRSEGRTVFVNFTADWCLSCKFNERAVLAGSTVQRAFAQRGVVYLKGDWTRPDPEITRVLETFGRSGVPLYLVYPNGADPVVLPQILTNDLVLSAIP
jgi:thiol:disulfide interchange protein